MIIEKKTLYLILIASVLAGVGVIYLNQAAPTTDIGQGMDAWIEVTTKRDIELNMKDYGWKAKAKTYSGYEEDAYGNPSFDDYAIEETDYFPFTDDTTVLIDLKSDLEYKDGDFYISFTFYDGNVEHSSYVCVTSLNKEVDFHLLRNDWVFTVIDMNSPEQPH